jgi:MoaA/NifB/PqqE/SkfB family radical SAM enzyme
MWEILQTAVDTGVAPLMELHYNTNGTLWPREVELWQHFKNVNLSFSIDGIGAQFESMRYLAHWSTVVENMNLANELRTQRGLRNLGWCVTVSSLNVYYLPEILEEFKNNYYPRNFGMYLNLVHFAPRWNISKLPSKIKEKIADRLMAYDTQGHYWSGEYQAIIDFMLTGQEDPVAWQDFLKQINLQNQFRNENYAEIFPEYWQIINDYEQ